MRALSFLSFLCASLLPVSAKVQVCGTVFLPPGVTLSQGELRVKLMGHDVADPNNPIYAQPAEALLGPNNRNFCLAIEVGTTAFVTPPIKVRLQVDKLSVPTKTIHSGFIPNLWAGTTIFPTNDEFHVDLVYLGASASNATRNLFFLGLKEFSTDVESEAYSLAYDLNNRLNKITAQDFPNGTLVPDGSFENSPSEWTIAPAIRTPVIIGSAPVAGSKVLAISYSNVDPKAGLISKKFQIKPYTSYTLSFYYRCLSVSNNIRPVMQYFKDANSPSSSESDMGVSYSVNQDWTFVKFSFYGEGDETHARISLLDRWYAEEITFGSGNFLFDQVVVEEGNFESPAKLNLATEYFDGLNKSLQTLQVNGLKSTYKQAEYDFLGRASKAALPIAFDSFEKNGRHAYLDDILGGVGGALANWYYDFSGRIDLQTNGYPFSETVFENSPLGRPVIHKAPGGAFHEVHARQTRSYYGSSNISTPIDWPVQAVHVAGNQNWFETVTEGQGDELSRTYTDLFGNVKRAESYFGGRWIRTDFTYDGLGNLTHVEGPPGQSGSVPTDKTYNSLKQMESEYSADVGLIKHVYDQNGRSRFSMSLKEESQSKFSYVKYDKLGRVTESGLYLDKTAFLQANADNLEFPYSFDPKKQGYVFNFYDYVPTQTSVCQDGADETYLVKPGIRPGKNRFKSLSEAYTTISGRLSQASIGPAQVTIIRFFDYSSELDELPPGLLMEQFTLSTGVKVPVVVVPALNYHSEGNGVLSDIPEYIEWGPMYGRLARTVTCNRELASTPLGLKDVSKTFNYDKFGNTTAIYEFNGYVNDPNRRWQVTLQDYDRQGRVYRKRTFDKLNGAEEEIQYNYAYDRLGRLEFIKDKEEQQLARFKYNELGQLASQDIGKGPSPVHFDFRYNYRGQLKEIKDTAYPHGIIYSQKLRYENAIVNNGEEPRWNGDISAYNYQLMGQAQELYKFKYDELDRLTQAVTTKGTNLKPGSAKTFDYAYHDNGTINSITRDGALFDYMYTANTNQLDRITFTGSYPRQTNPQATFLFDLNGRLVDDNSKNLKIEYSEGLDRPYLFESTASGDKTYMVYDEGGNRRTKVTYSIANQSNSKHYFTGKEVRESPYGNKIIFNFDGYGRFVKNGTGVRESEIFIKNNLGSTAEILNTSTGALVYSADYEPYGKLRSEVQSTEAVSEKFTTKENDAETGLDYFGARYFDAELGLWISPDPARQFHSPYSYSSNGSNPINSIDEDGRALRELIGATIIVGGMWLWIEGMLRSTGKIAEERNKLIIQVQEGDLDALTKQAELTNQLGKSVSGQIILGTEVFGVVNQVRSMKPVDPKKSGPIEDYANNKKLKDAIKKVVKPESQEMKDLKEDVLPQIMPKSGE